MRGICCQCQSECDCERMQGQIICSIHDAFGSHCEGSLTVPQVVIGQPDPDNEEHTKAALEIMGSPDLHIFPDIQEAERDKAWGLGRKH